MIQIIRYNTGVGFATLFPNPTAGKVNVDAKAVIDRMEVFNNLGALIFSRAVNSKEIQFTLDNLPSGLFIVKLYSGKESLTKKVMLIR